MALSRNIIPALLSRDWWDVWDFPVRIMDQHFGLGVAAEDYSPSYSQYFRPSRQISQRETGQSSVKNDPGSFQIMLDVSHFSPNELTVKTVDNSVVVHGKHEEKADQHGLVSREFTRRYMLPKGIEPETVTSSLSPDGILTMQAPKKAIEPPAMKEREVPITMQMTTAVEAPKPEQAPASDAKPQVTPTPEKQLVPQQPAATPEQPKQPATPAPEAPQPAPQPPVEEPKVKQQAPVTPEAPKPADQPAATKQE